MKIPPYADSFRVNYGQGQASVSYGEYKYCKYWFDRWNLGGSFIEFRDRDTKEWFPLEE